MLRDAVAAVEALDGGLKQRQSADACSQLAEQAGDKLASIIARLEAIEAQEAGRTMG